MNLESKVDMRFTHYLLQRIDKPDPLWLYKVGTSMIYAACKNKSLLGAGKLSIELAAEIEAEYIREGASKKSYSMDTALDPLIKAIADEACEFYGILNLAGRKKNFNEDYHEAPISKSDYFYDRLCEKIKKDVLTAYYNSAILVHLHRTGKITEDEMRVGTMGVIDQLNQYGANGLPAMWEYWDYGQGGLLKQLIAGDRRANPGDDRTITRASIFKQKMRITEDTKIDEEYQQRFWEVIPEVLGKVYIAERGKKESIIASHIRTGNLVFNDPLVKYAKEMGLDPDLAKVGALNRGNYKVMNSPSFDYEEELLNLTPEELKNIQQGKEPKTFNEHLDAELGGKHPGKDKVVEDLHGFIKTLTTKSGRAGDEKPPESSPSAAEDAPRASDGTEPKLIAHDPAMDKSGATAPESEAPKTEKPKKTTGRKKGEGEEKTKEPQAPSSGGGGGSGTTPPSEPPKKPDDYKGWVNGGKVATTILGSVLVADQLRRAKDKDTGHDVEHPDKEQERSEKSSKIIHYVLAAAAAAGVALVVFTKPEKLVKFVSSISEFFGKGGPSKA